ncbi:MAG: hypothetical protein ACC634_04760, partial [Hyphomicrobiales bacterium]
MGIADLHREGTFVPSERYANDRGRWKPEILKRACVIGLGCTLALGAAFEARAGNHIVVTDLPLPS